jgi:uncharacterized protein (DUF1919 family)
MVHLHYTSNVKFLVESRLELSEASDDGYDEDIWNVGELSDSGTDDG